MRLLAPLCFAAGLVLGGLLTSYRTTPAPCRAAPYAASASQTSQHAAHPDITAAAEDPLLPRVYPLHSAAAPWQTVPFRRYSVVLVTGPQRSGTTWAACALARSLGYTLYDERHPIFGGNDTLAALSRTFAYVRHKGQRAVRLPEQGRPGVYRPASGQLSPHIAAPSHAQVIQSPMASVILHLLPLFDGLLVLFMARNCLDVFRSQNKVPSCSLRAPCTPTTCSADSVDPPSDVCRCCLRKAVGRATRGVPKRCENTATGAPPWPCTRPLHPVTPCAFQRRAATGPFVAVR